MNIQQVMQNYGNVQLVVSSGDLNEFGMWLISKAVESLKQQEEKFLTVDEVCQKLGVSKNTLWRWNKDGYLQQTKVGRTPMYRQSDVNKLYNSK